VERRATVDPMEVPPSTVTWAYAKMLAASVVAYFILRHFWGRYMLTSFSQLEGHGFVLSGLNHVWFIFAWALGLPLLATLVLRQRYVSNTPRAVQVIKGMWLSVNAGFFEEVLFRGLMFLNAMVMLVFLNWLTEWLVNGGLVKWLYVHWFVPLANWATFHALQPQLMDHRNWVFGVAIVSVTVAFRDEHKYLGFIGWVNSWFIGMVMFWLVFHYGLLTAIVAHAVYDAIIFTIRGLASKKEDAFVTAILRMLRV